MLSHETGHRRRAGRGRAAHCRGVELGWDQLDPGQLHRRLSPAGNSVRPILVAALRANVTFLVGIEEARVPEALQIIRENCRERSRYLTPVLPTAEPGDFLAAFPVEVQVGGATVFVVPVDSFEKI
jgi:hypothetical protein